MESRARLENVRELKSSIVSYCENTDLPTLAGFLEEIALYTDIEQYDAEADAVVMMTMHAAKGLEFPHVFLVGLEEGLFPGTRSLGDPEEMEEERRLCYVAITRAKQSLTICYARTRMLYGRTTTNIASRFVDELPPECVNRTEQPKPKYDQPRDYGSFGRVSIYGDYESFSPRPAGQSAPEKKLFFRGAGDKEKSASGAVFQGRDGAAQGVRARHGAERYSDGRRRAAGNRVRRRRHQEADGKHR